MIFTDKPHKIKVHFTPFRDGLQSSFGGKVRLADFIDAMKYAAEAGIRHMEFGGGARYQAPLLYLGENPFETMSKIREAVGPDVELQILTRSVSGVTLTTQSIRALELQAKLMKKHGTTYDRNFDFMNDVRNLVKTGKPIVDAGMHHQVCIALMGLPFESDRVHTPEFYINIGKQILDSGIKVDSICLKDASGTTTPKTVYDTAVGLKKMMPPEMELWMHTHDTASTAIACYMAGIEGGVDGVDLSVRPLASGTVQPDVRSLAHGLKHTNYHLDIDVDKMLTIEKLLGESLKDYNFNPTTTTPDSRVLGFPMPGGAIGPNVHMMVKAGILDKYSDVLAEFPVVVEVGGAWTSVTPGSQQYWLQAFNNVMFGRWKKMDPGFGKSVLGYFGRTPLEPDPDVVKAASEQLDMPVFDGDPLEAAPDTIDEAKAALEARNLPVTDENTFLVVSTMVPGKKMELNEGIRYLTGKGKIDIPLKPKEEPKKEAPAAAPAPAGAGSALPVSTRCTVEENGSRREFLITVGPVEQGGAQTQTAPPPVQTAAGNGQGDGVFSTFAGAVEITDILVKEGQTVTKGQVLAKVEAMKAQFDIKAPKDGVVSAIKVTEGDEIDSSKPILFIK